MNTSSWSVADVSKYLKKIGLGQYSATFEENDISGSELPYLTDEYLVELGVKSIGHRIKLNCFIKSIKSNGYSFPPLRTIEEENDIIHPLPQNVYQKIFIESLNNEDQENSNSLKEECKVCHKLFNSQVIQYHQNICQDTFDKCKKEFARRSLNATDKDIIDLLVGNVPENAIKLEKCKYCGKKISPKLFQNHQKQCRRRSLQRKENEAEKLKEMEKDKLPKIDFKQKHDELIQEIKMRKKGFRKSTEVEA